MERTAKSSNAREQSPLFSPFQMEDLTLKNRIVLAALTRGRADMATRVPTDLMEEYYAQRADAGLIVSEGVWVSEEAIGFPTAPGLFNRDQARGWRKITDAVHKKGGLMVAQLWHQGASSLPDYHYGEAPLGPSAVNLNARGYTVRGGEPTVTARQMDKADIRKVIRDFASAAYYSKEAGFDGVQIQASYIYLFSQFLHSDVNKRTDEYGGSEENRARILFDTIEAVLEELGGKHVGVKFSPATNQTGLLATNKDSLSMFTYLLRRMNDYPLSHLNILGWVDDAENPSIPELKGDGMFAHARKHYNGTIMGIAHLNFDRATADINAGIMDLAAFGRDFLANPDLVNRLKLAAPLNKPNEDFFYFGGPNGYTDYPMLEQELATR